jgi:hypothetical protein
LKQGDIVPCQKVVLKDKVRRCFYCNQEMISKSAPDKTIFFSCPSGHEEHWPDWNKVKQWKIDERRARENKPNGLSRSNLYPDPLPPGGPSKTGGGSKSGKKRKKPQKKLKPWELI